jgi:hypothetical protein
VGEKTLTRSAYREAVWYFEQGLGALPHLPETCNTHAQAIDLQFALHEAEFLAAASTTRVGWNRSRSLCQSISLLGARMIRPSPPVSGRVVLHALANQFLAMAYQAHGDYRRAIDCFRQTAAFFDGARRHQQQGQREEARQQRIVARGFVYYPPQRSPEGLRLLTRHKANCRREGFDALRQRVHSVVEVGNHRIEPLIQQYSACAGLEFPPHDSLLC